MARLLVKTKGVPNPVIELNLGVNRVGRGPDNDFRIAHPSVSSRHCEVILTDGAVILRDCGSTNGTYVNGDPVRQATLLPGQTVHLGEVELFVETTEVAIAIPKYDRPVAAPPVVLADGSVQCPRHPQASATYRCTHCQEVMCDACVHCLRRTGGSVLKLCPLCSYPCEPLAAPKPKKKSFLAKLTQTIRLPFLHWGGRRER